MDQSVPSSRVVFFFKDLKALFQEHFPENVNTKRQPGRPRLKRLPFFLTWTWNRVWFKREPKEVLVVVNSDPVLREFFEIPDDGLKKTTYNTFTKSELRCYLEPLIGTNVEELLNEEIISGLVLAEDDFPVESPLNLSKAIDFPQPKEKEIRKLFSDLPSLYWIDEEVGKAPNKRRGWSDYFRLFLFYLLWGFPSNKSFNDFVQKHNQLKGWLGLKSKVVYVQTFSKYIAKLRNESESQKVFKRIFDLLLQLQVVCDRVPSNAKLDEFWQLQGLFGNRHCLRDPGARIHFNSSKGKYYFGRIGRILVDTWTQIPLWVEMLSAHQPLAIDLKHFGTKATTLLGGLVKPLLLLLDSGFRGKDREAALKEGFSTTSKIFITAPYNRAKPTKNIFRTERISVERSIGHLTVHLNLEYPPQVGFDAATSWVLGAVFLLQRISIYNHFRSTPTVPTALTHLQKFH
jgi:hypothetical protein